ncbi:MAG: BON domain-containing protein [Candidatus Pelagadaptatus aseana]|uniref:BON domain-containing protein n=1 Tax=Candidatus Pelagadaptatus aseana TaxID=3120508 RepID=UPI0039B25C85
MNANKFSSAKLLTALLASLMLSGCASLIDATTEEPLQVNPGKRSLGSYIDDQQLETIITVNLRKASPELKAAHLDVVSFNGVVLLTGQVNSNSLRQQASSVARNVNSVRQVFNEIQISGNTSMLARANDTWLTTKVKTVLMSNKDIDSGRIKIVTENGTVYLLGLLSRVEAEKAANVVSHVQGVQKVVKAIEYID